MDLQELEEDLQEVEVVLSGVVSLFIHRSLIFIRIVFVLPQLLSVLSKKDRKDWS